MFCFRNPCGLAWDKVLDCVLVQAIKSMSKPIKRCIMVDGDEPKLGCASEPTWLMLKNPLPIKATVHTGFIH